MPEQYSDTAVYQSVVLQGKKSCMVIVLSSLSTCNNDFQILQKILHECCAIVGDYYLYVLYKMLKNVRCIRLVVFHHPIPYYLLTVRFHLLLLIHIPTERSSIVFFLYYFLMLTSPDAAAYKLCLWRTFIPIRINRSLFIICINNSSGYHDELSKSI